MEFLLEVGCEEIPARFMPPALEQIEADFAQALNTARLNADGAAPQLHALGTPRRLALLISGLAERQTDLDEEILGPKVEVAYDAGGRPTKACQGFARSKDAAVEDLVRVQAAKGEVVAIRRRIEGQPAAAVLGPVVLEVLAGLDFPKTMRWGLGEHAFARPVHWLVALLGDQVLDITFKGAAAGRLSRGHRFSAPEPFPLHAPADYVEQLQQRGVVVEPAARQRRISDACQRLAAEAGGRLVADAALEQEVTHLTEHPVALLGRFDERFLELPREVLIAAMRNHQRYFSIGDEQGALRNAFVAVSNSPGADADLVRYGNERVLTARLADARFFYEVDQKTTPADRVPELQQMVFQADLGSYYDKAVRLAELVVPIAHRIGLGELPHIGRVIEALTVHIEALQDEGERRSWQMARAALLAKTDLLSEMVGEFPELQGEMGGEYARLAGEVDLICRAVGEHYRPRFAGDAVPASDAGAVLSLADRLDTLAGCFGLGLRPSGGADPYALRRACLGVIAIVLERGYRLSLRRLVAEAVAGVRDKVAAGRLRQAQRKARKAAARKKREPVLPTEAEPFEAELETELLAFFEGRLRQRLRENAPQDVVDAVLAAGMDDMTEAALRVQSLADFARQEHFGDLAVAFKRVVNIIKDFAGAEIDEALFAQDAERELHRVYTALRPEYETLVDDSRFDEAMDLLATRLREPVDRFFDDVLVNDPDDPERQANRKALLAAIAALFGRIADFSRLQTRDED